MVQWTRPAHQSWIRPKGDQHPDEKLEDGMSWSGGIHVVGIYKYGGWAKGVLELSVLNYCFIVFTGALDSLAVSVDKLQPCLSAIVLSTSREANYPFQCWVDIRRFFLFSMAK